MHVRSVSPVLNVRSIEASFAWFEKLGWRIAFAYGDPLDFGGVVNGEVEIFLCLDGQGCRGEPDPGNAWGHEAGAWMSWFLGAPAEVDDAHALAVAAGALVTWPPTDMPWGVRECHIRHPDGHTFRISASLGHH